MRPIIEIENLSKCYRLGTLGVSSVRETLERLFQPRPSAASSAFWSLKDVSFSVEPGQVVGIVGRNGAGKSTLLKILSRITEPTSGRAVLRGRVASLLEVGTGFHPELTGRENIYLNGALLGMKRAEINAKFSEIIAFAEVNQFLDTPVKRYSSGMYVRLAFAVAAHLESEILIIDEVLAVGDADFQKRCLGKMRELTGEYGRTVLFVSHNIAAVEALCTSAVLLEGGRVTVTGPTTRVLTRYLQAGGEDSTVWRRDAKSPAPPLGFANAELRLTGTAPGQQLHVALRLKTSQRHSPAFLAIDIQNAYGASIMQALPSIAPYINPENAAHQVEMVIDLPPLIPGHYTLTLWAGPHYTETYDCVERALGFEIEKSPTRDRTFGHAPDHGYIVPHSTFSYQAQGAPEPAGLPV